MGNLLIGIIFLVAALVVVYLFAYKDPESEEEKSEAQQLSREDEASSDSGAPCPDRSSNSSGGSYAFVFQKDSNGRQLEAVPQLAPTVARPAIPF